MFVDDIVEFSIATDRRDKVQHATNIRLVDDTFFISKDKREKVSLMMMMLMMMMMMMNITNLIPIIIFLFVIN